MVGWLRSQLIKKKLLGFLRLDMYSSLKKGRATASIGRDQCRREVAVADVLGQRPGDLLREIRRRSRGSHGGQAVPPANPAGVLSRTMGAWFMRRTSR